MKTKASILTPRMLSDFCAKRLAPVLPDAIVKDLQRYMVDLLIQGEYPPYRGAGLDLTALAQTLSLDLGVLKAQKAHLSPVFDAIARSVAEARLQNGMPARQPRVSSRLPISGVSLQETASPRAGKLPGRKRLPVIEFPEPLFSVWEEPQDFGAALKLHASRHGETTYHLFDAVVRPEDGVNRSTVISWGRGTKLPRAAISLEILGRIERRYRLPAGYFSSKTGTPDRAPGDFNLIGVTPAEHRRLASHLPEDFNLRSQHEQAEILDWVRNVVISGSTEYRRYQAAMMRQRYAVRFSALSGPRRKSSIAQAPEESGIILAPKRLNDEMASLLKFKTSTFAAFGLQRNGVWGTETASQKVEHFGLWFGAFAAPPDSEVQGLGVDPNRLTFAMMIFPQVWDWYLTWRERRRGFYTKWEVDLLSIAAAFCRTETGWLRQTPRIADSLGAIDGLISLQDMVAMSQLIDAAVNQAPAGIIISNPDPDALGDAIKRAVAAGIPVISMNSGIGAAKDLGIRLHVGQDELPAGVIVGERLAGLGLKHVLCINQEVGNVALDQRCAGVTEGFAGGTVTVLPTSSDPAEIESKIQAALTSDTTIDLVLGLSAPQVGERAVAVVEKMGVGDKVKVASYDLSANFLQSIVDGKALFAVDQQPYLQGSLPVVFLAQFARYGTMPAGNVASGPSFVTAENAAQVIALSAEGIR